VRLARAWASIEPGETITAWVFLRDKGNPPQERPFFELISERSLRRRLRVRSPEEVIDSGDMPLDPSYVAAVAARVHQVRQRSKWLNAVSVEATREQLAALRGLLCVRSLEIVAPRIRPSVAPSYPSLASVPPLGRSTTASPLSSSTVPSPPLQSTIPSPPSLGTVPSRFDYGWSLNQLQQIRVVDLHNMGLTGKDVFIGHFDNGYRLLSHESLTGLRVHAAWDFVANEPNPDPIPCGPGETCDSHGLETLSILAGFKEGKLIGPAFEATYLLARTESDAVESTAEEDLWVAAMEWADSIGVDVVSSSVGYRGFDDPLTSYTWEDMDGNTAVITRAADMAVARGIVVVAAIGNDGLLQDFNTIYAPADGDSVLAVGAIDQNGAYSILSSYGPTADGRTKPDVLAEGIGTIMALSSNSIAYGGGFGTSAACPLVAGAAALLRSAFPAATPVQIATALRSTASRSAAPDRFEGWGIIDALAAYRYLRDLGPAPSPFGGRTARIVPNPYPVGPTTPIQIELPEPAYVTLQLFDVRGRRVRALLAEPLPAAEHTIPWNGLDDGGHGVASGAYFLQLQASSLAAPERVERETRKVILLR